MTIRHYYSDAYTTHFSATVVSQIEHDSHPAVLIADSYFYPTSGGQRHDLGQIGDAQLIDVQVDSETQALIHILDKPLAEGTYEAQIDWARRFDHMQQHSGQHILSQAFIQIADAATVGFHMGDHACTIDLGVKQLSAENIQAAELLANQIIWENRPINCFFIDKADIPNYPIRKVPDVAGDKLRIVDITDFDTTACGGTHVRHTGEIGQIKITKIERIRKQMRIEFRCGQRALVDYDTKNALLATLANSLTCAQADLPNIVGNLSQELKQVRKALKKAQSQILQAEAHTMLQSAETHDSLKFVRHVFERRDSAEVRQLAQQIGRTPSTIALLAIAGKNSQFIMTCAKDTSANAGELLKTALGLAGGSGGGSAQFAQGGGAAAKSAELETILQTLIDQILES